MPPFSDLIYYSRHQEYLTKANYLFLVFETKKHFFKPTTADVINKF